MKTLTLLALFATLALPLAAQSTWNTTLVWGDGNSDDRIDVVIMGDGYTQAEIPLFHTHVTNFVNAWRSEVPVNRYQHFINIWRIDVESAQSGSDKPGACFNPEVLVDTALDSKYCTGGTQRCLTANNSKVFATAGINVPEYDEVIVAVNDATYGGCANSVSCYSAANNSALQVAIHELGHSIFGLADEYENAGATYTGGELGQVNVSIHDATAMASLQTKWHYWLGIESVSTFEGARYHEFGIYRPRSSCKMRSNGPGFCPICREEHVETILGFHNDFDATSPAPGGGPYSTGNIFSATLPKAGSGAQWSPQWAVDGTPVTGGSVSTDATSVTYSIPGSVALAGFSGQHVLSLSLVDTTTWYRKQIPFEPFPSVSWTVSDVGADFVVANFSVLEAPSRAGALATVSHTIQNQGQTVAPSVRVGYYLSSDATLDASDRLMDVYTLQSLAPGAQVPSVKQVRVPVTATSGSYFVLVRVDDTDLFLESDEVNNTGVFPGPHAISTDVALQGSTTLLPGTLPTTLQLTVNAGPEYAGLDYYMVPSTIRDPNGPGSWLGPLIGFVDLTFDQLTYDVTGGVIGAPIFNDFAGVLDANGQASASFFKPALPPGVVGQLHFAYAVIQPGILNIPFIPFVSETRTVLIF